MSETVVAAENCTGVAAGRICAAAEAAIAKLTMGSKSRCGGIVIFLPFSSLSEIHDDS